MTNSSALADIINEFVTTERSYVNRLKLLKHDYADPLRTFARSKETAIIAAYEAKTIFGNIDALLPVNEAFLEDLEKMTQPGGLGIGDVALKHFKMLKGFENYKQYYHNREQAQSILEKEIKKSSGFAAFIDVRTTCFFSILLWSSDPSGLTTSASNTLLQTARVASGYANS